MPLHGLVPTDVGSVKATKLLFIDILVIVSTIFIFGWGTQDQPVVIGWS